jgi:hypothetical protein
MRGTAHAIEDYLSAVATLLERYGVIVRNPSGLAAVELLEDAGGHLSFELLGHLPDGRPDDRSEIAVREVFERVGDDQYERIGYEYELIDRERDYRRTFHLHYPEWFRARYLVLVHEHCERPIGRVACEHYEGSPLKDAFAGIAALLDVWTSEPPDCDALRCLEPG